MRRCLSRTKSGVSASAAELLRDAKPGSGSGALSHQRAIAAGGRGAAALQHQLHDGGRIQFLRTRRDQGLLAYLRLVRNPHDSMALQRVINTRCAASAKRRSRRWSGWLSKPGSRPGTRSPPPLRIASSPHALRLALETFRQLILDAQAMMDSGLRGQARGGCSESQADDEDKASVFGAEPAGDTAPGPRKRRGAVLRQ